MNPVGVTDTDAIEPIENVYLTQLSIGDRISLQAFEIQPGATVPEHNHHHEQCVFVFEGKLTFVIDDRTITVGSQESFIIPGDVQHYAENREETKAVGVSAFSPPRPADRVEGYVENE